MDRNHMDRDRIGGSDQDMIALSLSGDTYPIRRELHSIGAIWSYELKAHIVPADRRVLLPAMQDPAPCPQYERD
jgi:hypothetical protein